MLEGLVERPGHDHRDRDHADRVRHPDDDGRCPGSRPDADLGDRAAFGAGRYLGVGGHHVEVGHGRAVHIVDRVGAVLDVAAAGSAAVGADLGPCEGREVCPGENPAPANQGPAAPANEVPANPAPAAPANEAPAAPANAVPANPAPANEAPANVAPANG
ncbi:hypothetical protein [Mycolicibacterium insubricum]|uniref:hypothetical protein n=1 Tax=Mycolicibacterium insubricum TaxID=444597 RepID=UPI0021F2CE68|nr:hypothetical protein [Mycolicibacterium insubricum]MCV7081743.1 hypothetical protein [Mycolicibacterium insubricum]